jgi:putative ABC transport system substrate-binding protein
MRRREFITLLGSAATWPLAARAQQQPAPAVIGMLAVAPPEANANRLQAFREGLRTTGHVEGQNVNIEYDGRRRIPVGWRSLRRNWCMTR